VQSRFNPLALFLAGAVYAAPVVCNTGISSFALIEPERVAAK